jgi:hypothetical protein
MHQMVPEVTFFLSHNTSFLIIFLSQIEFAPATSPLPTVLSQEQTTSTTLVPPHNRSSTLSLKICMICTNNDNGTSHFDPAIATQTGFSDIKSLASRLIVGFHSDEIEKKLLRFT